MSRANLSIPPSRSSSNNLAAESANNTVARAAVAFEYAALRNEAHAPLGMYVTPSEENLMVWNAVFFVHQGYYEGSIFKFTLTFPPNYPQSPPAIKFVNPPYHPLIDEAGIFNLGPLFRPWRPKEHHIFHVLHWIKAAFKKHALDKTNEDDAVSKGALRYREDPKGFANQAIQSAKLTRARAMDKPSPVPFTELKPEKLEEYRTKFGLRDWASFLTDDDNSVKSPSSQTVGLGIIT
ncbi:hypothetical protein EYR36_005980 [Pleurotus pulmonarius]|nr:hypothetical protein EYR36_005980 [Pleurotus pulmonarius]KAF4600688.1 hypothetical protein EYR38_005331 [Pleurotus pulmonarius]